MSINFSNEDSVSLDFDNQSENHFKPLVTRDFLKAATEEDCANRSQISKLKKYKALLDLTESEEKSYRSLIQIENARAIDPTILPHVSTYTLKCKSKEKLDNYYKQLYALEKTSALKAVAERQRIKYTVMLLNDAILDNTNEDNFADQSSIFDDIQKASTYETNSSTYKTTPLPISGGLAAKVGSYLTSTLGLIGWLIFIGLSFFVTLLPLLMFNVPWWADVLLSLLVVFVIAKIPFGIEILYIVGLFGAILGPQDFFAILYYILFALIVGSTLIKLITAIVKSIVESRSMRY